MTNDATAKPQADVPSMPDGYILGEVTLLPWSWAVERLEQAQNYWFSTTRPDGRPHAMPAWAVWLDGVLYFEGSPETRRARNIAVNPAVSIHLESGTEVLILEGEAREAGKPERPLAERLAQEFTRKYSEGWGYKPEPEQWDDGGLWRMQPKTAFGWSEFPKDLTRWRFRNQ
jgi:nitroimidazol reductase NimA-like FMN-containing flavoprotein (pyridoxamine 5'-phosphate oxidase superfamily)